MKLFKKTLILVGTLVTFVVLLALFTVNASALSPEFESGYDPESGVPAIYYFSDYYPTVDHCTMVANFPDYQVYYDHQWVNQQTFTSLVGAGYFEGVGAGNVIIIDIKTFKPDTTLLENLFSYLKGTEQCTTAFVSIYEDTDFSNTAFLNYLDVFFTSYYSKLDAFIDKFLDHTFQEGTSFSNKAIFIDGRLMDVDAFLEDDLYNYDSLEDSVDSVFMSHLFDQLSFMISEYAESSISGFQSVLEYLYQRGTQIFIHDGENGYVDLYTKVCYEATTMNGIEGDGDYSWLSTHGIGFWNLDPDFYDLFEEGQDTSADNYPPHVMECDPFVFGDGGLTVEPFTEPSDEETALLAILLDLIE